jgi:hypothetical protein
LASRRFFFDAGHAFAACQLVQHLLRRQAELREQHHRMEPQVGALVQHLRAVAGHPCVLGGHDRFGGFLADLLEDGVVALLEQARDVRLVGVAAILQLARFDHLRQALQGNAHLFFFGLV